MDGLTHFLVTHGYAIVAFAVLIDQIGIPIPAIPVLVAVGAVSGDGALSTVGVLAAATAGSLPSDLIWYRAGRRRGGDVLRLLCRISLEPDSCVRNTEATFTRYGPRSLVFAKFIPAYQTLAPALAGMTRISLVRFLAYDTAGAFLWCLVFVGAGALLHDPIDEVVGAVSRIGLGLVLLLVVGLAGWIGWKFWNRRRFLRSLRIARIEAHELKELFDEGAPISILDLRNTLQLEVAPHRIPGARVVDVDELEDRHEEIPRDREIILYCT
ncbi:MAG: VTT domain-containing protein [Myxococcota bacterium]